MTTHVLRPTPPLRSYLVAAVLATLGALMVVGSGFGKNPWILVFGALVLADGLVLVLMTTIKLVPCAGRGRPRRIRLCDPQP